MSNFIQPVYRLSRTPVSDETPLQACRQLFLLRRRVASFHSLTGCSPTVCAAILGRNLSLVTSDRHLDASLCRDLEDAKQSSPVLRGESHPPSSQPGVSSPSKRFANQRMTLLTLVHLGTDPLLLRLSSQVLRIQKMTLHPLVHMGDGPAIPFAAATRVQPGPSHPEDDPAYAGPSRRWSYDSLRVRLGILLARGVILLLFEGVGSRTIRLPMRARRLLIADNGTISRMTSSIFVMLLWLCCWPTS